MKYLAMSPRPKKIVHKIRTVKFQILVNNKHLAGLFLILFGVIILQLIK